MPAAVIPSYGLYGAPALCPVYAVPSAQLTCGLSPRAGPAQSFHCLLNFTLGERGWAERIWNRGQGIGDRGWEIGHRR